MNQEERINSLERKVIELMNYIEARERQQLVYPLDQISQNIISTNFIFTTGDAVAPVSLLSADTALEINVNGINYWLLASPTP